MTIRTAINAKALREAYGRVHTFIDDQGRHSEDELSAAAIAEFQAQGGTLTEEVARFIATRCWEAASEIVTQSQYAEA